ncbi:MAG TPA: hypothetical protein VFC19_39775 [Candidatus Limnocylindrales bacterium]|nr:hypothetical protein [Candidatus Limnocylindrales bacterium]
MDHQRFRKVALGVLAIAIVLLGLGGWQARSLLWETVTGTAESCTPPSTGLTQKCLVTWTAGGKRHAATVSFDDATDLSHTDQTLYVDDEDAYPPQQRYLGPLLLGGGLFLTVTGLILRRKPH